MNCRPEPEGYWSEVRGEGPVYGTGESVRHVLGTFASISPILTLRWLRGEARRIADRLDPDPTEATWVRPTMRKATTPVPDCPTELRAWAADPDRQRAARDHIKAGHPLCATFRDTDCTYTFSACPIRLPTDEPAPPVPTGEEQRHRPRALTSTPHRSGRFTSRPTETRDDP
ncbi:hypothetical protein ACIQNU_14035 [Streptomyces sp. NPDC091292]|uniref:hypothetical protein n=1 Tax=Streptomyces sp. NPDC091292 TaxID=3365991 RepID=UPI00381720AC